MKLTTKTRRQIKIQQALFYLLMIGLAVGLAQLSIKTNVQLDWTATQRHSLSETSKQLLRRLDTPIVIQAFISPSHDYQQPLKALLDRYLTETTQLKVHYIDSDFSPDLVRELNIQQQAELVVSAGEQQQHVYDLSEQGLTNAIMTVSRQHDKWLVFIEGHGERKPDHQANFNLSTWTNTLKQKGFKYKTLNLAKHPHIPRNAAAVIIASSERPWLEGEITLLQDYLNEGGNLLWLTEPDTQVLSALSEYLGISVIPGTLIDPNTALLGIPDPQFALITDYANHPIAQATTSVTLYPKATALEPLTESSQWQYLPLLATPANVWSDITPSEQAQFDPEQDTVGPLNIGYLLTPNPDTEQPNQRIAVIGDGDFLSNSFIGNASNLELGMALVNWLVEDDDLIQIPVKTAPDKQLALDNTAALFIGLGFLVALPATLLLIGLTLWWYRRKQ